MTDSATRQERDAARARVAALRDALQRVEANTYDEGLRAIARDALFRDEVTEKGERK